MIGFLPICWVASGRVCACSRLFFVYPKSIFFHTKLVLWKVGDPKRGGFCTIVELSRPGLPRLVNRGIVVRAQCWGSVREPCDERLLAARPVFQRIARLSQFVQFVQVEQFVQSVLIVGGRSEFALRPVRRPLINDFWMSLTRQGRSRW